MLSAAWAGTTIWEVGPSLSLQDAIAQSAPGDVVQIRGPEVRGSYHVTHALTIEAYPGDDVTAVVESGPATAPEFDGFVNANAQGKSPFTVVLRNLTIEGQGSYRLGKSQGGATLRLENVLGNSGFHQDWGGCLLVDVESAMEIEGGRFSDCKADGNGGGVTVRRGASLVVTDGRFEDNESGNHGGALHCLGTCEVRGSTFVRNVSDEDGGALACVDDCTVVQNLFLDNRGNNDSGALDVRNGTLDVRSNRFCGNSSGVHGGAVRVNDSTEGAPDVTALAYNVFWGNEAGSRGGAVWLDVDANVQNNTFVRNRASEGAAVMAQQGSVAHVVNSIVVDHEDGEAVFSHDGSSATTVSRVLHWDPDGDDVPLVDLQGSVSPSPVVGDPLFVDGYPVACQDDDLRLTVGSPAIGEGDPSFDDDLGAFPCVTEQPGNGIDEDCDGQELCFVDRDGDGFAGTETELGTLGCDGPGEFAVADDCDDTDVAVFPGGAEVCDGLDGDCNGLVDDVDGVVTVWPDTDGDGVGAGDPVEIPCVTDGFVAIDGDCDPQDASVYPGAPEVCDGGDRDCDGFEAPSCGDPRADPSAPASAGCSCSASGGSPGSWTLVLALALAGCAGATRRSLA